MSVTVNLSGLDEIGRMLNSIDVDLLCYDVAYSLKAEIKNRIHIEGKAADGSKIGTYSKGYMKVRTGIYPNTSYVPEYNVSKKGKVSKKRNKTAGEQKDDGVFTKVPRAGQPRPVYNRKNETDVILSLTRQMEKDMDATLPIKIEGGYGIGFSNDFNYDKSQWNDKRYGKTVYDLTDEEERIMNEIVDKYIEEKMQ
ncbi:MAG: hypothetical protein LBP72_01115 [Dysgonamonadaceae bacterium]|jgi:hypothetical protein|nr:hypothetical protein [Dysgonamonadaceae bacterium]